jgi:hypothetical protein
LAAVERAPARRDPRPGRAVSRTPTRGQRSVRSGPEDRRADHAAALGRHQRPDPRRRRQDPRALDNRRVAFGFEERDQGFASGEFADRLFSVELGIGAQRLRGGLDRLLIARRERAQRVLHAIAELRQDVSGMSSGFWVTK